MEWEAIAAYLNFHLPFFILAWVIWKKCRSRRVAISVVCGLILSHVIALGASFFGCFHDDDTPLILHLCVLYAIAPPLMAWVFVVLPKVPNAFRKAAVTVIGGYLGECALFFITLSVYSWICPFQFK